MGVALGQYGLQITYSRSNLHMETQLIDELLRKVRAAASVIVGYQLGHFVLSHHDSKPLLPTRPYPTGPFRTRCHCDPLERPLTAHKEPDFLSSSLR